MEITELHVRAYSPLYLLSCPFGVGDDTVAIFKLQINWERGYLQIVLSSGIEKHNSETICRYSFSNIMNPSIQNMTMVFHVRRWSRPCTLPLKTWCHSQGFWQKWQSVMIIAFYDKSLCTCTSNLKWCWLACGPVARLQDLQSQACGFKSYQDSWAGIRIIEYVLLTPYLSYIMLYLVCSRCVAWVQLLISGWNFWSLEVLTS